MAAAVCLLLLLSCSIAAPTSSLAAGRQDGQMGGRALGKAWLCNQCSETPSAIPGTDELDEVPEKRTSRSPSHRRWSPSLQGTGLRQTPSNDTPSGAALAPFATGAPDLSAATSSQVPAEGPSASHTEPASSSKRFFDLNRRPHGSLKKNPEWKAEVNRERQALAIQKIKDGELVDKTKPGGSKYAVSNKDEYRARTRANSSRYWSNLPKERKESITKERSRRSREMTRAKRESRSWQGPPLRRPGRPRRDWAQEKARAEEVQRHVSADARMEEATQHGEDGRHAPPGAHEPPATLWLLSATMAAGSSSLHASVPGVPRQFFPAGPSSSSLDLYLSLSAPGSSKSGQKHSLRQVAPPAAGAREEEMLRLTLAPPDEHDRLRLALAPPRHH